MEANFDEAKQSQLVAVELLINMGYKYLSRSEVQKLRGGDNSKFILRDIAFEALKKINHFEYQGEKYDFSDKNIFEAIDDLENMPLNGLQDTAKEVYQTIMTSGGRTFKERINGKEIAQNFRFIDFANPENNSFHVVIELTVNGKNENCRPDIVCFVNGIPFVVIENKKSGTDIYEAITQMNRNQKIDYCPKFFVYPQLLIGTNVEECLYGVTGTANKFYAAWKEKMVDSSTHESEIQYLIKKPIDNEVYKQICSDINGTTFNHTQLVDRLNTAQDKGLYELLKPKRLLDLTKNFILFDAGLKKIARYQQYFAINKIFERIELKKDSNKRDGGVVWHTQGSGKSLTMVLFVKALIESSSIENARVIIITDRIDLDEQISKIFRNCNLKKKVIQASTGKHLIELIKEKNPAVITSLVHKFDAASNSYGGFIDNDSNIFVLVDEAHRTQYGIASEQMRRMLPNACFIGFTGTPLLKNEKSRNRFGSFIDKYTIDDALNDGIILPLIYEGRYTDLKQDAEKVNRFIDRITQDLNEEEKKELQKFINKKIIKSNPFRIAEIALDIEEDFIKTWQNTGLKAQIVAPSKYSAILFQKIFEESSKINTAVVISETQTYEEEIDDHKKEVSEYLKKITENYKSLESYEKEVIESFKDNPDGIEIIIVVDKLLTGFDAPRNTILYLTKDLKDHNLLQAIARVNRLFDNAEKPKTSGFIVDYSENAQNIKTAMDLFGNYDGDDVKNTLIDTNQKIHELEQSFAELDNQFREVKNKKDSESYLEFLGDEFSGEQRRNIFYKGFNNFLKNLDECMSLHDFSEKFKHLDTYKMELKKYAELRKSAQLKFADKRDLSEYKVQLVKILSDYITAEKVEFLTGQININDKEAFANALATLGSDKSKAEAIASQIDRVISEKADSDPEFYSRFSEKIHDILKKMREGKIADIQALKNLKKFYEQVINKEDEYLPEMLKPHKEAGVFYRNLKDKLYSIGLDDHRICKVILDIWNILKKETIIDWHRQPDKQRVIKNILDDYLYDEIKINMDINISQEQLSYILDHIVNLALENYEIF